MKIACLAVILGSALATPAQAARPSYSYFDAAYLKTEVDGSSGGAEGVRLAFNVSLNRWVYFTAGHDQRNVAKSDVDLLQSSAGFGLHSLKSTFQVFGAGTYERTESSGGSAGQDEGFGVLVGARLPIRMVELQADYKYLNFGDFADGSRNDEERYRLIALAHVTKQFALTSSYEIFEQNKDVDQWTVGARFYFNNRHDQMRRKRAPASAPASPPPPPESIPPESIEQEAEPQ